MSLKCNKHQCPSMGKLVSTTAAFSCEESTTRFASLRREKIIIGTLLYKMARGQARARPGVFRSKPKPRGVAAFESTWICCGRVSVETANHWKSWCCGLVGGKKWGGLVATTERQLPANPGDQDAPVVSYGSGTLRC